MDRDHAPTYLDEHLSVSGFGSTKTGDFDAIEEAKKWQKKKSEAGWACIQWPEEYGGRGASPIESVIWNQEEGHYGKLMARSSLVKECARRRSWPTRAKSTSAAISQARKW